MASTAGRMKGAPPSVLFPISTSRPYQAKRAMTDLIGDLVAGGVRTPAAIDMGLEIAGEAEAAARPLAPVDSVARLMAGLDLADRRPGADFVLDDLRRSADGPDADAALQLEPAACRTSAAVR